MHFHALSAKIDDALKCWKTSQPRTLSWLCHSVTEFKPEGAAFISRQPKASLAVLPLGAEALEPKIGPTTVMAGKAPGQGMPEVRGFTLKLTAKQPNAKTRFINLLLPLGAAEKPPTAEITGGEGNEISLKITWADGKTEKAKLNLDWKSGDPKEPGPATMSQN